MATNLKDIQAANDLKTTLAQSTENIKKNFDAILEALGDSLKTFEKNEMKTRREYNQLKMTTLKAELQKRGIEEKKIEDLEKLHLENRYREFNKHYEKTKKALKLNLTELEDIEKKQMRQRIAQNKEFYGKVDVSFKKFNEGMTKVAGNLDSMLGVKVFGALSKVGGFLSGTVKNVFKATMGGAQFLKNWREEGFGKAFQQTKLGQGAAAAGQALRTGKEFLSGKTADERRAEKDKESRASAAEDKVMKANKETTTAIQASASAEEKHRKKWWAWEVMKFMFLKTLDIGKALLGLGTAPWILKLTSFFPPIAAGLAIGGFINRGITSIADKISKHSDRMERMYVQDAEAQQENKTISREKWQTLGVDESTQAKLTREAKQRLAQDKRYLSLQADYIELEEKFNKDKGLTPEEDFRRIQLRDTLAKKLEQEKDKAFLKTIENDPAKKEIFKQAQQQYKLAMLTAQQVRRLDEEINRQEQIAAAATEMHDRKVGRWGTLGIGGLLEAVGLPQVSSFAGGASRGLMSLFTGRNQQQIDKEWAAKEAQKYVSPPIGDDVFNIDQKLQEKGIHTYDFNQEQKEKLKTSKEFLGGLLNRPTTNPEADRTLTIPYNVNTKQGKRGKSIILAPGVNFEGLQPNIKSRFTSMSDEYFDKTGHIVGVNSAMRTLADQINLFKKYPHKAAKPGRSPHQYGYAIDANSWNLNEMDSMGLLDKYGFERKARTKTGELETWHLSPKGMTKEVAPMIAKQPSGLSQIPTEYEAGDDVFTDAMYMKMGEKFAESFTYSFTKDKPGKMLSDLHRTTDMGNEKNSKEIIRLLLEINNGIRQPKKEEPKPTDTKSPPPSSPASSQEGGSAGFKTKSEIFPSDVLTSNMYAIMTQFSGGY